MSLATSFGARLPPSIFKVGGRDSHAFPAAAPPSLAVVKTRESESGGVVGRADRPIKAHLVSQQAVAPLTASRFQLKGLSAGESVSGRNF